MKFSLAVSALFASTSLGPVAGEIPQKSDPNNPLARLQLTFDETPCLVTAGKLDEVTILKNCTPKSVGKAVKTALAALEGTADECAWDAQYELRLLTKTLDNDHLNYVLEPLCADAEFRMTTVLETTQFSEIHEDLDEEFMETYTKGGTFLNTNTGNVKNAPFEVGQTKDRKIGKAINKFYKDKNAVQGAKSTRMASIDRMDGCEHQAMLCCFGRDRQFGDDNGDCAEGDCVDKGPGDNSNICYAEDSAGDLVGFAGDEQVHCHGFVWAADEVDASYALKFNSFFFVLMHDHFYTRGYVQNSMYQKAGIDDVPMCGCLEDMPTVTRADCSEVNLKKGNYALEYDESTGTLTSIEPLANTATYTYNACQGEDPDDDGDNNDLMSQAKRLNNEGTLSDDKLDYIQSKLVGEADNDDADQENQCVNAWNTATGNAAYERRLRFARKLRQRVVKK